MNTAKFRNIRLRKPCGNQRIDLIFELTQIPGTRLFARIQGIRQSDLINGRNMAVGKTKAETVVLPAGENRYRSIVTLSVFGF